MAEVDKHNPLMIEAWKKATLEPVTLRVASQAEATSLRHQLYRCRVAMKKDKHELATSAERVTIIIRENKKESCWIVIMQPAQSQFDDVFHQAGIDVPKAPELEL